MAFAFKVELVAAIHVVSFAWDRNWRKLWLEADSMYLVVPWRWRPAWEQCLDRVSQMMFHVSHIYHEGNQAVDGLAS